MKKNAFIIVMVVGLLLTSCGSKSSASDKIDVTMVEFMFTPNTFTVPAGKEITIHAVNNGSVVHEFVIMKFNTSVGEDFGAEDESNVYWKVELQPGSDTTTTFTAPTDVGEYQVVCGTKGHYTAGMVGKLIVVAEQ